MGTIKSKDTEHRGDRNRIVVGCGWFGHKTAPILQNSFYRLPETNPTADQGVIKLSCRLAPTPRSEVILDGSKGSAVLNEASECRVDPNPKCHGLHAPLNSFPHHAKFRAMKKHFFLFLAFAGPFVFTSCSFSIRPQRSAPIENVRTTTEKTTTNRPHSTTVETQTSRSYY